MYRQNLKSSEAYSIKELSKWFLKLMCQMFIKEKVSVEI
jgi:hypothetical protein